MFNFEERMERTDKTGTSSLLNSCAADVLDGNHAGPDGKTLTVAEIYKAYCLRQTIRKGWKMTPKGWVKK